MAKLFGILTCLLFFLIKGNAQDWAGLKRYQAANVALKDSSVSVVYLGDSITDFWLNNSPAFFSENHYIDRGISGQTSPQMLVRFRQDVISLKPKVVVILCGTNDIAGNTGPSTLDMIEDNIRSMCELARANKIKFVLCSVLPAGKFYWSPNINPAPLVIALNNWIKEYAAKMHLPYADYYTAMKDDQMGLSKEYSQDGVHPNKTGYQIMERIIQPLIKAIL